MSAYILDSRGNKSGEKEIHNHSAVCENMPMPAYQKNLGNHVDCESALYRAREKYPLWKINACPLCCKPCYVKPME